MAGFGRWSGLLDLQKKEIIKYMSVLYKHQYFILDPEKRKVFDENNKELKLTGNAFLVLVFLCEYGTATVTDIGDGLDRMKDYDEDHIRQYRYKINTIIGRDIMKYKNKVYFIEGKVEKSEKIEKGERNTEKKEELKLDENKRITVLLRPSPYNKVKESIKTLLRMENLKKLRILWGAGGIVVVVLGYSAFRTFKPGCEIKGNINLGGEKIYHLPGCASYDNTEVEKERGEKWFCSEDEAVSEGWRKAGNCK